MATASEIIQSASTAPDGSTASTHLKSAEARALALGLNLESTIDGTSGNLDTETASSDLGSIASTVTTLGAEANLGTLTSAISC